MVVMMSSGLIPALETILPSSGSIQACILKLFEFIDLETYKDQILESHELLKGVFKTLRQSTKGAIELLTKLIEYGAAKQFVELGLFSDITQMIPHITFDYVKQLSILEFCGQLLEDSEFHENFEASGCLDIVNKIHDDHKNFELRYASYKIINKFE